MDTMHIDTSIFKTATKKWKIKLNYSIFSFGSSINALALRLPDRPLKRSPFSDTFGLYLASPSPSCKQICQLIIQYLGIPRQEIMPCNIHLSATLRWYFGHFRISFSRRSLRRFYDRLRLGLADPLPSFGSIWKTAVPLTRIISNTTMTGRNILLLQIS